MLVRQMTRYYLGNREGHCSQFFNILSTNNESVTQSADSLIKKITVKMHRESSSLHQCDPQTSGPYAQSETDRVPESADTSAHLPFKSIMKLIVASGCLQDLGNNEAIQYYYSG